jgi:hypothetical protein
MHLFGKLRSLGDACLISCSLLGLGACAASNGANGGGSNGIAPVVQLSVSVPPSVDQGQSFNLTATTLYDPTSSGVKWSLQLRLHIRPLRVLPPM